MTHIYTEMAIDAFRRQEQARRRLAIAEARVAAALQVMRTQPEEEFSIYVAETEKIRIKMDERGEREGTTR